EPPQRALDLLGRLLDLAARVGVLDPQQALAALVAREQPVEEEGADPADVQEAGRARRHADADAHAGMVVAAVSSPIRHTEGIRGMLPLPRRVAAAASQSAFDVPITAATGPAIARPSGALPSREHDPDVGRVMR